MTLRDRPLRLAAAALVLGVVFVGWAAPAIADGAVLGAYGLLFAPYFFLLHRLRGPSGDETRGDERGAGFDEQLAWIVGAAVLARLVLLPADPLLSDDIYRYVWDGRVGMMGINPFRYAPGADALAPLRDPAIWEHVNHPEVPTIYPPGAQYLFELNAWLGGTTTGLKTLFVGLEAACAAGAWWVAGRAGIARDRRLFGLAIYALNPLVVVETAWSGHLDVVAWSLLAVALLVWTVRRTLGSALAAGGLLGACVAVKFLGLVAVPFLLFAGRRARGRGRADGGPPPRPLRHRIAALAVVPLVVLGSYLPYLDAGPRLFAGFGTYAEKWRSNDGGFRATSTLADTMLRRWTTERRTQAATIDDPQILYRFTRWDAWFKRLGITEEWQGRTIPATTFTARQLAALLAKAIAVLVVGLAVTWALFTRAGPLAGTTLVLVTLFLFAPVVHPWYVGWLVPLCALRPNRTALTFSAAVLIAYLAWWSARAGGDWSVPTWAVAVEYGAVLVAAAVDVVRRRFGGDDVS